MAQHLVIKGAFFEIELVDSLAVVGVPAALPWHIECNRLTEHFICRHVLVAKLGVDWHLFAAQQFARFPIVNGMKKTYLQTV